jgi:hypothetical protein
MGPHPSSQGLLRALTRSEQAATLPMHRQRVYRLIHFGEVDEAATNIHGTE